MLGWKKPVLCFFCNHEVKPRPPNPQHFRCVKCDCWNRYDKNGDLISDERAMYEETLNADAFSKRGSPRKDALPTVHTPRVFCRTCQTNQTLYLNLLSNYLPDDDDPNYDQLLAQLPEYKESLGIRYPLVCADCSGNVEEQLKRSERLGRSNALGSWLRDNTGKETHQTPLAAEPERRRPDRRQGGIWVWRARGCLWVASMVVSVACSARAISNPACVAGIPPRFRHFLPAGVFLSIFWAFWDPLWSRLPLGKSVSRKRSDWIVCQAMSWVLRLMTTLFIAFDMIPTWLFSAHVAAEIITFILSVLTLRPPMAETSSVRLTAKQSRSLTPYPTTVIPTSSTTSFEPPSTSSLLLAVTPQPDDILSTLSLSGNPSLFRPSHAAPVFGQTSALGNTSTNDARVTSQSDDTRHPHTVSEDVMDWDPVTNDGQQRHASRMYNWMRPQVFFPPSEPTGLEGLLHTTSLSTEQENKDRSQHGTAGVGKPIPTMHVNRGGAAISARRGDALTTYLVALLVASLASSALLLRTGSWSLHQMWNISASDPMNNLSLLFQARLNDQ